MSVSSFLITKYFDISVSKRTSSKGTRRIIKSTSEYLKNNYMRIEEVFNFLSVVVTYNQ